MSCTYPIDISNIVSNQALFVDNAVFIGTGRSASAIAVSTNSAYSHVKMGGYTFTNAKFIDMKALSHSDSSMSSAVVTFVDCTFTGMNAKIYVKYVTKLEVVDCNFIGVSSGTNTVINATRVTSVDLNNNIFRDITGSAFSSAYITESVTITDCTFANITASSTDYTVAVKLDSFTPSATISGSVFYRNSNGNVSASVGGAIYVADAIVRIFDSFFLNNVVNASKANGGAIYHSSSKQLIVHRTAFLNNVADSTSWGSTGVSYGGAIYSASSASGGVHIDESLFGNNAAIGNVSCGGATVAYGSNIDLQTSSMLMNSAATGSAYCCVKNGNALLIETYLGPLQTGACDDQKITGDVHSSPYQGQGLSSDRETLQAWMQVVGLDADLKERFLQFMDS
tara:strand:+ start:172 stop:1359 length:1188 start_codon:yes stop_codon:yes gene_type:complete